MINKIIDEINTALNNELYLVALTSALTIPDVCGKAEYPDLKTSERYKKWYSNYVKEGNISEKQVYALRCSLLHEGNVELEENDNYHFVLKTNQYTNSVGIDFCLNIDIIHADGISEHKINVYVGYLCAVICKAAKNYYCCNKEKFSFLNYEIYDIASAI